MANHTFIEVVTLKNRCIVYTGTNSSKNILALVVTVSVFLAVIIIIILSCHIY